MFERILYIVSEKQEDKGFVMQLAREHKSTVLLSGIFTTGCRPEVKTDGSTRSKVVREDQERKCWEDLYHLEEELKVDGIKSSVITQEGSLETLQKLAVSTHCDLIVLAAGNLTMNDYKLPDELVPNLPCPLIITNTP